PRRTVTTTAAAAAAWDSKSGFDEKNYFKTGRETARFFCGAVVRTQFHEWTWSPMTFASG
ncbi:MAG: hypothetical protein VCA35_11365, partial [Roseibacillus sp.]